MRHPLLYEINTRCWLAELSQKTGRSLTLADIPDSEFEFWQRCRFTHIWLMGVWATGRIGLEHSRQEVLARETALRCEHIAGSPYAITGYEVSPKLGGGEALAEFRRKLNQRGIKLILDFIPNHTAIDHPWVKAHPEFYVTSDTSCVGTMLPYHGATKWFAHGHCGHGEPWVDTLQLDYRNPELRQAMIGELLHVAQRCDGVRCDMAMLELNDVFTRTWQEFTPTHESLVAEFWTEAIGAVRQRHQNFLFLAEVYWDLERRLQELGFDFTYDKGLYDRMVGGRGGEITTCLHDLPLEFIARSAHFIENHDERRVASLLSPNEHRAAALLIAGLPGMRLIHEGQMTGSRIHANVHLGTRLPETADSSIASFYQKLFDSLPQTAVGSGEWHLLRAREAWAGNPTHQHIALVQWQREPTRFDLVVVNLSAVQSQCYAPLRTDPRTNASWRLADLLSEETHARDGNELAQRGLYLDLPAHAAQLFHAEVA